jgi:hypothetical protein
MKTEVSVCAGFTLLISVPTWALNSNQFQESIQMLKQSQQATDRRLKQLGVSTRLELGSDAQRNNPWGNSGSEEKEKPPLFVLHEDGKRLQAPAGKLLFGRIHNRLLVSGDDVPVVVILEDQQGVFSGLRALGKARLSGTEGRISIEMDRIVTRQGKTIPIKGSIQDDAGAFGLEAQVLNSKALAMVGAMAGSFISGLAASQQTLSTNSLGFEQAKPSGRNAILQGVAQTAADQSKRLIDQTTQEKPILLAERGTEVTVYLDEEVRF